MPSGNKTLNLNRHAIPLLVIRRHPRLRCTAPFYGILSKKSAPLNVRPQQASAHNNPSSRDQLPVRSNPLGHQYLPPQQLHAVPSSLVGNQKQHIRTSSHHHPHSRHARTETPSLHTASILPLPPAHLSYSPVPHTVSTTRQFRGCRCSQSHRPLDRHQPAGLYLGPTPCSSKNLVNSRFLPRRSHRNIATSSVILVVYIQAN